MHFLNEPAAVPVQLHPAQNAAVPASGALPPVPVSAALPLLLSFPGSASPSQSLLSWLPARFRFGLNSPVPGQAAVSVFLLLSVYFPDPLSGFPLLPVHFPDPLSGFLLLPVQQ